MNDKDYKSCSSCFFSEKFPGVVIEKNGRCNFCNHGDFKARKERQTTLDITELHRIAEELKKERKGKYDCIIGASGGLDSSYVIYIARKILQLNPLVIKYDHGFNYSLAASNLETICKQLGIDFKIVQSSKKYDLKYIRSMVLALRDLDVYWGICGFCHYILLAVVYKYALEENISTIFYSGNLYQSRLYLRRDFKLKFMLRNLRKLSIAKLARLVFYMMIAQYYFVRLKLEFYVPPLSNILRSRVKMRENIKLLNVTRYVRWDIDEMVKAMEEEMGWRKPREPKLPMRFDCKIEDSLINHTYTKAVGLTVQGIICNNLIYDGIRTKSKLRDTVQKYNDDVVQEMRQMLSDLKLDYKEK